MMLSSAVIMLSRFNEGNSNPAPDNWLIVAAMPRK
jgi:hypothetical protein